VKTPKNLSQPLISDTNREAIFGSIVATIPPGIALAKYVNEVKGASSHLANHLEASQSD
jgi:hypothetical protein